ncbi:MAG: hypothetical protein F6K65_25730 [Moorea sp. SIO3C2]|nr:hypothetical protein [Moorena sp. SIO3C2]
MNLFDPLPTLLGLSLSGGQVGSAEQDYGQANESLSSTAHPTWTHGLVGSLVGSAEQDYGQANESV